MKIKVFAKELRPKQHFWLKQVEPLNCGVETEINIWLADNPDIIIKHIEQSMSGGSWMPAKLMISIWYEGA